MNPRDGGSSLTREGTRGRKVPCRKEGGMMRKRTIGLLRLMRLRGLLLFVLLWWLLPLTVEASRPVLIEGAMSVETEWMIEALAHPREERIGGWRFVSGDYQGTPVVVAVTSVGMSNAAAVTALGIERFHPVAVINQGTAGGHNPVLHVRDIVVGARSFDASAWISHQEASGADGRHVVFYRYDEAMGTVTGEAHYIPADATLLAVAMECAKGYRNGRVIQGTMATSNSWNRQMARIQFLYEQTGSSCEEMETFAAAVVCQRFGVPFVGIRVISNTELYNETFQPETGLFCQQFALTVAKAYAEKRKLAEEGV